jgi:nitric oxide reductase activation protein
MQSSTVEAVIAEPAIALEPIRRTLQLFFQALSGRNSLIASYEDIATKRQRDTGRTVRLPASERLGWYRVALAHRAMHDELRTMRFRIARPGKVFPSLRPGLPIPIRRRRETDLQLIVRAFADPHTALDCFVLLEDLRVDEAMARRYPGLRRELDEVQREELERRPPLTGVSVRTGLLEVLARLSLGWRGNLEVPVPLVPAAQELVRLAMRVTVEEATVEDVIEATIRAYELFSEPGRLKVMSTLDEASPITVVAAEPWSGVVVDLPLAPVRYRDALLVRLVDPNEQLHLGERASFEDVLQDSIIGPEPVDLTGHAPLNPLDLGDGAVLAIEGADEEEESEPNALQISEDLKSFVYGEWDYRAGAYRERWCRVVEVTAPSTHSTELYRDTLRSRRTLVADIRRQFERIVPETLQRVRRVREGEELDLDACIEAFADLRAGIPPSDAVYQTRERGERDVAVVFLVDLSQSTQEMILSGGSMRRIIDVARESLILLVEPLVRLGDVFGMYGFSGTSRRDVRFVVIKDINERLNNEVLSRLESLRPYHTTRMGAAIRHATSKLKGHQTGTRLLIVISDGRPFDVDYGQEYGKGEETEYAINDTRAALDEARAQGIRPFLLTVDAQGADYMATMMNGLDYELLDEVAELPARLAALYHHLTLRAKPALS